MLGLGRHFKVLFEMTFYESSHSVSILDRDDLPESSFKYQLLGLNLLRLLAQNKLADFHTVSREGTDDLFILSHDERAIGKMYLYEHIIMFPLLQELELLPPKDLHQNVYIKHPVSIEQYLMEGSYNKVSFNLISMRLFCQIVY